MTKFSRNILIQFTSWYLLEQPRDILKACGNFLRFNFNYWSIPLLLKTLFSYWRRYSYSYGKGFSITRYFEAFTFNAMSRILGMLIRIIVITIGVLSEILLTIVAVLVFLGWFILPVIIVGGFCFGLKTLHLGLLDLL